MFARSVLAPSVAATSVCCAVSAKAADERTEGKQAYDLPRGDATTTLQQFAALCGQQVLFMIDKVQGEQTNAIAGIYSTREALDRMLAGTALVAREDRATGGFVVSRQSTSAPRREVGGDQNLKTQPQMKHTKLVAWILALFGSAATTISAQTAPEPTLQPAAESSVVKRDMTSDDAKNKEAPVVLDAFEVTGTRIRGGLNKPVGSDAVSIDMEVMKATGLHTTAEFFNRYPGFSALPSNPAGNRASSWVTGFRGFFVNTNLILIDGFRMIGNDPSFSSTGDIGTIPPAAVERIEILPDGASAVYGSDAVAGVINIITRKNVEGGEITYRTGWGRGPYKTDDLSALWGHRWKTGSLTVAMSYNHNTNLQSGADPYYTFDSRFLGGVDLRSTSSPIPHIVIGGVTYAPPGYAPNTTAPADTAQLSSFFPEMNNLTYLANFRQKLTDDLSVFANLRYADLKSNTSGGFMTTTVNTTSANPFFWAPPGTNATSETLLWNVNGIFGVRIPEKISALPADMTTARSANGIVGLDYTMGTWKSQLALNYSQSNNRIARHAANLTAIAAGAVATTTDQAIDFFGDRTNPAVVAKLFNWFDESIGNFKFYNVELNANGPVFRLPAGEVRMALGGSYYRFDFDTSRTIGPIGMGGNAPGGSVPIPSTKGKYRRVEAGFAEALIPVIGQKQKLPVLQAVNLSAAVRHDRYSDFGGTTNTKFGITADLVGGLSLRGSYSTSFHAPEMINLYSPTVATIAPANSGIWTLLGRSPTNDIIQLSGGNTKLQPETSTNRTVGLDFKPKALPGLSIAATYYNICYANIVGGPPFTNPTFFADPATAKLMILNPTPAQITQLLAGYNTAQLPNPLPPIERIILSNLSNYTTSFAKGIDLHMDYEWNYGIRFTATANKVTAALLRPAPPLPITDNTALVPHWTARGGALWGKGVWKAGAMLNYTDGYDNRYTVAGVSSIQRVRSTTTLDLNASYTVKKSNDLLNDVTFSVNMVNALNEKSPRVINGSWSSELINLAGRVLYLSVDKKF